MPECLHRVVWSRCTKWSGRASGQNEQTKPSWENWHREQDPKQGAKRHTAGYMRVPDELGSAAAGGKATGTGLLKLVSSMCLLFRYEKSISPVTLRHR